MYLIIDIDGTLSNTEHRLHLVTQKPKNHKLFHELAKHDPPYVHMCDIVYRLYYSSEWNFVSGRPKSILQDTVEWLQTYLHPEISAENVFLRDDGDNRPDFIVKEEIIKKYITEDLTNCVIIDDRPSVQAYFRAKGATVLDPGTWDQEKNPDKQMKFLP